MNMQKFHTLCRKIEDSGGEVYYVGGAVRDKLLGRELNDYDVVVRDLSLNQIKRIARTLNIDFKEANENRYPFLQGMVDDKPLEITVPRDLNGSMAESANPAATIEEDAHRRDFTFNAIYQNVLTDEIIDPVYGVSHLEQGIVHPVSNFFSEDPQRVLRAFAAISLYDFNPSTQLVEICSDMASSVYDVPDEVVGKNLLKACKGQSIHKAFAFLQQTNWLTSVGALNMQSGFDQQNPHHQETLLEHSLLVAQAAQHNNLSVEHVLAGLFHDTGKLTTQSFGDDGVAHYYGHEVESMEIARKELNDMALGSEIINKVVEIIEHHMRFVMRPSDVSLRTVRRLYADLQYVTIQDMINFNICDNTGRIPHQSALTALEFEKHLPALGDRLEEEKFQRILQGRDVLEMTDIEPGPAIGEILDLAKEAQINGTFDDLDGAKIWLKRHLAQQTPRVRVYLPTTEGDIFVILELIGIPANAANLKIAKEYLRQIISSDSEGYLDEMTTKLQEIKDELL